MTISEESFRFSNLFEAELLLELMLRFWQHPLAHDREFRNNLIESASGILRSATEGHEVASEIPVDRVNFVLAVWIAEKNMLDMDAEVPTEQRTARLLWLDVVRRVVPSCFCNPEELT